MKKPSKCYTCYGVCYIDYTLVWNADEKIWMDCLGQACAKGG
jgi:hypothetical protein